MATANQPEPGLPTAREMLQRIGELSARDGLTTEKLNALAYTVELAKAHALLGIGQYLVQVHDQLVDMETAYRRANGLDVPE